MPFPEFPANSTGAGAVPPQPGAFAPSANNQGTGASQQIGEFGGYPVGQVDVRTDFMKLLEGAAMPMLLQLLTNPGAMQQTLAGMGGAVPQARQQGGLSDMLFGAAPAAPGGAPPPTGQPPTGGQPQQPPAWPQWPQQPPTGGQPPGGGQPPPAQPPNGGQPPGYPPPTDNMAQPPPPNGNPIENMQPNLGGAGQQGFPQPPINPALVGSQLGGGQIPINSAAATSRLPNPTELLAKYGLGPQSLALSGLVPGSGAPGQEMNLGYLNQLLNPQGYLSGVDYGTGQLALLSNSGRQDFSSSAALQQALQALGVQFRAAGGPLDPNAFTMVGEWGPEMIGPMGAAGKQQVMPMASAGQGMMPQLGNGMASLGQGMPELGNGPMTMNSGQYQPGGTSATNGGMIGGMLQNNPEQDVFNQIRQMLSGQGGMLSSQGGAGQGVVNAMQPVFQQNLKFGLNELTNRVPSVYNTGAAIEGTDLTSRALNDFNLQAAQALQGGQQTQLQGAGLLGSLAGQAGNGGFNRALQAGQLSTQRDLGYGQMDLAAQQQQWNQQVAPTLQLLLAALGMATPTAFQTVVPGKK